MRDNIVVIIAGMAVATYLTRFSFLYLFRSIALPGPLKRGFRYLPVGILAAMIMPGLVLSDGRIFIHWQNIYLVAGIASVVAVLKWKNMFASLGSGLAVVMLLKAILT